MLLALSVVDRARYWSKVDKNGPYTNLALGQCWDWIGAQFEPDGYGAFWVAPQNHGAHRVALWFLGVDIPDGLHVLHRCHRKQCVNPWHLRLGTRIENAQEALAQGAYHVGERHWSRRKPEGVRRGAAHHNAFLDEAAVRLIRAAHASGEGVVAIARRYEVSHTSISNIIRRKRWKHVV